MSREAVAVDYRLPLRERKAAGASIVKYWATGRELCEECLFLDGVCFDIDRAIEIEDALTCSCSHAWHSYSLWNSVEMDDRETMKRSLGLSATWRPCASICPPDLFVAAREAVVEGARTSRFVENYVENRLRDARGLPRVGEGWVNETALYRIVQALFPEDKVVHHYRADWLGRLELDVYVVGANVGFEYQGIQHYEPQEHWGGAEAFVRARERDAEKRRRCAEHGTRLVEVRYDEDVTEEVVRRKLGGGSDACL